MKAIRIYSYGRASELTVEDAPRPQIKADEVLVKIHDAGVNPVDWKIRAGHMREWMPATFPLTLGQDFAGEIMLIGPNVERFSVGQRVFGCVHGSYAEYAAVDENSIAVISDTLPYDAAAALPTPGLTAYQIIVNKIKPRFGQKLLIHGAAGAVGSLTLQLAKLHGVHVTATAAIEDHRYLKILKADKVIDYKTQYFEEFAKDMDAVVDLVGGDTLTRSYQCVRKGGIVVSTVGPVDDEAAKKFDVHALQFMMQVNGADLKEVARLAQEGKIKPRFNSLMPLEKAREAQELNETGRSYEKVVLHIS